MRTFRLSCIVLILCVFVCKINAQIHNDNLAEKNDQLFSAAVEKYHSKKYAEAIPLFKECCGIDSLIYPPYSSRFSYSSVWLSSCYYKLGDISKAASISEYYMTTPIDRRLTVKSDSISDLIYPILYEQGDGEAAIPLIREVLRLEINELGDNNVWVGNTYGIYGYALLLAGRAEESLTMYKQGLSILEVLCGKNSKPYMYFINDIIGAYTAVGDYETAYSKALELVEYENRQQEKDTSLYYTGIFTCGDYLVNCGKYEQSMPFLLEACEILSSQGMENSLEYAVALLFLGKAQLFTGESAKSFISLNNSYTLFKDSQEEFDQTYLVQCMDYLSQTKFVEGDKESAISLCKDAISLYQDKNIKRDILYPELHFNLYNMFESLNDSKAAHLYAEQAIRLYRDLNCKDMNYANMLYKYAGCVSKEERYRYSIDLASEALAFVKQIPDIPDSVLVMYRSQLADSYSNNGDIDSAYYHASKLILDVKTKFSPKSLNYIHVLSKIAPILWFYGDRDEAINIYQEALRQVEDASPNTASHYDVLTAYARICQWSNFYTEAVDLQKKAVSIAEDIYGKESEAYIEASTNLLQYLSVIADPMELKEYVNDMNSQHTSQTSIVNIQNVRQKAMFAVKQGNTLKAEEIIADACQHMERQSQDKTLDYSFLLMLKAELNISMKKNEEALSSLQSAYAIATEMFGKERFEKYFSNYWNLLGVANINLQRWDDAETAFSNSISSAKLFFGESNMEYLLAQAAIAVIKNQKGDYKAAVEIMSPLYKTVREQVFAHFATMSSSERSAFWTQISGLFNPGMPYLAYCSQTPAYYGDAYNALLLSKGLLLSTEQEVSKLLQNSNDKKGLDLYRRLQNMRQRLNNLQINNMAATRSEVDSLREAIRRGERDLMAISSEYGDYTQSLRYTWMDVKKTLENQDVAIEFTDFYDKEGSNLYVALVLKKDMEYPQLVQLFDYSELNLLDSHGYYTSDSLYNLVWKPLEQFLTKDSKVFFSPQGVLHSIAIESLTNSDGLRMSELHPVYRLSSTRELCMRQSLLQDKSAVLYGGINYNFDNDAEVRLCQKDTLVDKKKYSMEAISQHRGAITDELTYLPGSEDEVKSIAKSFASTHHDVHTFVDTSATESSIKKLSTSSCTILHIATHGYYLATSDEGSTLSMLTKNVVGNQEDISLLRSGLFFAGANTTLAGEYIGENDNDGILTAKEIANLDMTGLDMVSLSACQTGLGDISGDGVFGLQRGFKKAGVKSLIMSLWNVDDKATSSMMTEFYKGWLSGLSKYESLEVAKNKIRSTKGWEAPQYWAAFILLDGIY